MKKIFALLIAAPILALFIGIGVLAIGISQTWDERNTDALISNLSLACVLGGLAMSFLLSTMVGFVLYARWRQSRQWTGRGSERRSITPRPHQPWMDTPPTLPPPEIKGQLYSSGPHGYEDIDHTLFGDSPTEDSDWRESL